MTRFGGMRLGHDPELDHEIEAGIEAQRTSLEPYCVTCDVVVYRKGRRVPMSAFGQDLGWNNKDQGRGPSLVGHKISPGTAGNGLRTLSDASRSPNIRL
jgi:hypothetical protein